jgi:hypothetical protein
MMNGGSSNSLFGEEQPILANRFPMNVSAPSIVLKTSASMLNIYFCDIKVYFSLDDLLGFYFIFTDAIFFQPWGPPFWIFCRGQPSWILSWAQPS